MDFLFLRSLAKALHVIFYIAWMAGLLYLPRLFIYHTRAEPHSLMYDTFVVMEKRLLFFIMTPSCIATFFFGGILSSLPGVLNTKSYWMFCKLLFLFGLLWMHWLMVCWWKDFKEHRNKKTHIFFRSVNEIPFVLAILIVIVAVFRIPSGF